MSKDGSNTEEMTLQQQLVAYLDGELDTRQSRHIEQLLAGDPQVREGLRKLDHTWELLDELDTDATDDDLTQTTLEMVTVEAERVSPRTGESAARRRRWLLVGLSLIAATVAGFTIFSLVFSKQNARLSKDLTLLRNLDYYRQTNDVEWLRTLDKKGLFADVDAAEQMPVFAEEGMRQLDPAELPQLARSFEQFEQMAPGQQDEIRRFHEQLQADADSARLQHLMRQYVDWLAARPPQVRAALFDLPADRRAEALARMLSEQTAPLGKKPGGKTPGGKSAHAYIPEGRAMQGVLKWLSQYAMRHEKEIRKAAAEEKLVAGPKRSGQSSRAAAKLLMKLWQVRHGALPFSSEDDLKQVCASLPEKARKKLESKSPEKQWQAIGTWVKAAMNNRTGTNRRSFTPMQQEERLNHFFEKTISNEQRRRLTELPSEEFDRELRKLYQERTRQPPKTSRKPGRKKSPGASAKQRAAGGGKKPPATRPATRP